MFCDREPRSLRRIAISLSRDCPGSVGHIRRTIAAAEIIDRAAMIGFVAGGDVRLLTRQAGQVIATTRLAWWLPNSPAHQELATNRSVEATSAA